MWDPRSAYLLAKELDACLRAACDLRLALFGWGEGAPMAAFIHLDAVDIDAAAGESAGEMHRVGGDDALERGATAFRAFRSLGAMRVRGLDLAAQDSHGGSFAERN